MITPSPKTSRRRSGTGPAALATARRPPPWRSPRRRPQRPPRCPLATPSRARWARAAWARSSGRATASWAAPWRCQAPALPPGSPAGHPGALRGGGAGHRPAGAPRHPAALRPGPTRRRAVVLHHARHPRPHPRRGPPPRPDPRPAGPARPASPRGSVPPGSQAPEHQGRRPRRGDCARLGTRQAVARHHEGRHPPGEARAAPQRGAGDAGGPGGGHARLHADEPLRRSRPAARSTGWTPGQTSTRSAPSCWRSWAGTRPTNKAPTSRGRRWRGWACPMSWWTSARWRWRWASASLTRGR